MKIGILTKEYGNYCTEACAMLGLEPKALPWTENLEADVEAVKQSGITLLLVQPTHTHHGVRVAGAAMERLGIEPIFVTSGIRVPTYFPYVTQIGPYAELIAQRLREGDEESGSGARLSSTRWALEQAELAVEAAKAKVVALQADIARGEAMQSMIARRRALG